MKYHHEPFDSNIFNKKVAKLFLNPDTTMAEITNALQQEPAEIVFAFTPFSHTQINQLNQLHFELISLRSTYAMDFKRFQPVNPNSLPAEYQLLQFSTARPELKPSDIETLANIVLTTSRYSQDQQIDQQKSLELYKTWVTNSLYHGYTQEVFILMHNGQAAGYITLKITDTHAHIDLFGIACTHQGKGLGKYVLSAGLEYLRKNDITDVLVITEGENIPANIVYQKAGFIISSLEMVYHRHT